MLTLTSVEAQNRFGQLLDAAQREPVAITRRGRPVAMLVAMQDYEALQGDQKAALAARVAGISAVAAFRGVGQGASVANLLADRRADRAKEQAKEISQTSKS